MDCVEGALVSGFAPETVSKMASFLDDCFAVNGVSGDDLFVDELLDFSNDFDEEEEEQKLQKLEEKQPEGKEMTSSVPPEKPTAPEESAISINDDFGPLPESELSFLTEGLESLEWLSHFVEDSFSDYSLTGKSSSSPAAHRPEQGMKVKEPVCFATPVQTKARSKRARTGVRVWPVLSPSFTESSTSSSSSTSTAPSFSFPASNPRAVQADTGEVPYGKPPPKKQKKKPADAGGGGGGGGGGGAAVQPRRCSHCGVTKTPQWRAGPLGLKTLCNACGVRFKSGRLLPEYRPACSPTFSSELHSNNHRKVLEMRRKKETDMETPGVLPAPVQSF